MAVALFFDLDGVVADFISGAFALHGRSVPIEEARWDFCEQIGFQGVNDPLFWCGMGFDFWRNLAVHEDGLELLRATEEMVGQDNIALLSSPCDTDGCLEGKRAWVARHLPAYRRRLFLGSAKHLFAGLDKILVDDHDKNCEQFEKAGGLAVMPPRPWNVARHACLSGGRFDASAVAETLAGLVAVAKARLRQMQEVSRV